MLYYKEKIDNIYSKAARFLVESKEETVVETVVETVEETVEES